PGRVGDAGASGVFADPLEDQPDALFHFLAVQSFVPQFVAHARTRPSRISGSRERSGSSAARGRSLRSPSRLIHTAGMPSAAAGARSWNGLAATWTCRDGPAPERSRKTSQWPWAGLYEPDSVAVTARSGRTPRLRIDAARRSGSVLERMASFHPRTRTWRRAAGTSANAGQPGSESARAPSRPRGTTRPSISATPATAAASTPR